MTTAARARPPDLPAGHRVADIPPLGPVTVQRSLGHGSFGAVYEVADADGRTLAMKVEGPTRRFSQLEYEGRVYDALRGLRCVPRVHGTLQDTDGVRYLIMDCLGRDLQAVMDRAPSRKLPLEHALVVAVRVLDRLRDVHAAGFVHRDVKPQNFLLHDRPEGTGSDVWIVDFGLAKRYRDAAGTHVPFRDDKPGLTGTPRFASTFAQAGCETARRDDLESLLYMLAYLVHGSLPWQRITGLKLNPKTPAGKREKNRAILARKRTTSARTLFGPLGSPVVRAARYVRALDFAEEPDYDRLRNWLAAAYVAAKKSPAV